MLLPDFNFHKPKTLSDAYQVLDSCSNAALMAGGTDLLVEMKLGRRSHDDIISLNEINELQIISEDDDNIYIGPAVNFWSIQHSDIIKKYIPDLINAVSKIGSHQVRNSGTIGGNLCTCASCADSAPILIANRAEVEVGSSDGLQRMMLTDFQLNHHKINITKGQILTRVIVPKPKSNFFSCFQKFGLRESSSISVASVAVGIWIENSIITDANIVVGACAPTPLKCRNATNKLINIDIKELHHDSSALYEIAELTSNDVTPIDDIRGSAEFRKEIVKAITKRAILNAISNYQG
jgi:carbon-monoxide dehydrogenase medium subunit